MNWPGNDAALLVVIPAIALVCLGYTTLLRRTRPQAPVEVAGAPGEAPATVTRPAFPASGPFTSEEMPR